MLYYIIFMQLEEVVEHVAAGGWGRCSEVGGVNFRKGGGVRRWALLFLIFFSFSCLS